MPGKTINQKQVNLYMSYRKKGLKQSAAAAKSDISVRSARRIDRDPHHASPKQRTYRTRKDPLNGAFEQFLQPLLEAEPSLQPMTLFEHLTDLCPGQFDRSCLRTIQRRVKRWLATEGPDKEVMFLQSQVEFD